MKNVAVRPVVERAIKLGMPVFRAGHDVTDPHQVPECYGDFANTVYGWRLTPYPDGEPPIQICWPDTAADLFGPIMGGPSTEADAAVYVRTVMPRAQVSIRDGADRTRCTGLTWAGYTVREYLLTGHAAPVIRWRYRCGSIHLTADAGSHRRYTIISLPLLFPRF